MADIVGETSFDDLIASLDIQPYDIYRFTARTENKLLGGRPKDPHMELGMLQARYNKGLIKEETYQAAIQAVQDSSSTSPEEENEKAKLKSWTGFLSDDKGIYIGTYQLKAGIKEAASALFLTKTFPGSKQILQHSLFVRGLEDPDKVYFYRQPLDPDKPDQERERIMSPDGYEQLIAHLIIPHQGPRSTIKFHDYVNPQSYFEFEVWLAEPKKDRVDLKYLATALKLCENNGWGCSRSQGYGRNKILTYKQTAKGVIPEHLLITKSGKKKGTTVDKTDE